MDPIRICLGHKLKEQRESKSLTLAQLAEASGIAESELKKLESEMSDFPLDYLFTLAPILKFKPSILIGQCERERKKRLKNIVSILKESSDEHLKKFEEIIQKNVTRS